VKAKQKRLHRQIASQFKEKRMIPFVATDQEISYGRDITWALRAKTAPKHIRELGWHKLDCGDDRYRHQRRQTVSGRPPVSNQPAHHPRGTAATGARPLES